ncbi:hypothetical protein CR513_17147, partial [Mucuna pruriens]
MKRQGGPTVHGQNHIVVPLYFKGGRDSHPNIWNSQERRKFRMDARVQGSLSALEGDVGNPPMLTRPYPGTPLYLYISVFDTAISSVLIQEREGEQRSVYFTNKVLQGAEKSGPFPVDGVVTIAPVFPKLQHNRSDRFVYTIGTTKTGSGRKDGRVERSVVRGPCEGTSASRLYNKINPEGPQVVDEGEWYLSVDGSSNQTRSGARMILEGPEGILIEASNNQVEYEALWVGMRLTAKSDSKLITGQMNDEYQARDPQSAKYQEWIVKLASTFEKFILVHVLRDQNERANLLAKLAST